MKPNIGNTEKIIRVIIGVALLSLLFVLEGNARYLGLIGVIPLVTAAISWCPVWALLGINTCPATQPKSG
jgi:hypothetical protein